MQEKEMQEMKDSFKIVIQQGAKLDAEIKEKCQKAMDDIQKINERYAEFYQSIPKNIKIESEVAALRMAKGINNVGVNRTMANVLAEKSEEELQEIGNRLGISQDDANPEEGFHDTEFNHFNSDKKVGYTSVFEGDTYLANEPHGCINAEYAVQMQNAENSLQDTTPNEVETDEFHDTFPGESVEEENPNQSIEENQGKKKGSFFGFGRILKR